MGWNKVSEKELPFGEEVIAFNEKWIDEGTSTRDGDVSQGFNRQNERHGY